MEQFSKRISLNRAAQEHTQLKNINPQTDWLKNWYQYRDTGDLVALRQLWNQHKPEIYGISAWVANVFFNEFYNKRPQSSLGFMSPKSLSLLHQPITPMEKMSLLITDLGQYIRDRWSLYSKNELFGNRLESDPQIRVLRERFRSISVFWQEIDYLSSGKSDRSNITRFMERGLNTATRISSNLIWWAYETVHDNPTYDDKFATSVAMVQNLQPVMTEMATLHLNQMGKLQADILADDPIEPTDPFLQTVQNAFIFKDARIRLNPSYRQQLEDEYPANSPHLNCVALANINGNIVMQQFSNWIGEIGTEIMPLLYSDLK